jgi:prepilin signal peptidase PulO-like enzyme (type II secretory pathway)
MPKHSKGIRGPDSAAGLAAALDHVAGHEPKLGRLAQPHTEDLRRRDLAEPDRSGPFLYRFSVHRLPDRLTAAAAVGTTIALTVASVHSGHIIGLGGAAVGATVAGLFYLTVLMLRPASVAFGDVKTAAVVGLLLGSFGLRVVFAGLAAGVLIGAVIGLGLAGARRLRWRQRYAHGPAILAGALLAFCWAAP